MFNRSKWNKLNWIEFATAFIEIKRTKNLPKHAFFVNNFILGSVIQQNGLCISGLSIQAATKIIECTQHFKSSNVVINVGSVDILYGHDIDDMCADYKDLIHACERHKLQPIISTLSPLPNSSHSLEMREKLLAFNAFLSDAYISLYPIIDIWSIMASSCGHTDFSCFKT